MKTTQHPDYTLVELSEHYVAYQFKEGRKPESIVSHSGIVRRDIWEQIVHSQTEQDGRHIDLNTAPFFHYLVSEESLNALLAHELFFEEFRDYLHDPFFSPRLLNWLTEPEKKLAPIIIYEKNNAQIIFNIEEECLMILDNIILPGLEDTSAFTRLGLDSSEYEKNLDNFLTTCPYLFYDLHMARNLNKKDSFLRLPLKATTDACNDAFDIAYHASLDIARHTLFLEPTAFGVVSMLAKRVLFKALDFDIALGINFDQYNILCGTPDEYRVGLNHYFLQENLEHDKDNKDKTYFHIKKKKI